MKQLALFLVGIVSGLLTLFFIGFLRFTLEPDYVRPRFADRNNTWTMAQGSIYQDGVKIGGAGCSKCGCDVYRSSGSQLVCSRCGEPVKL